MPRGADPLVLTFQEVTDGQRAWVGGKAVNLARMRRKRFPVPKGFVVTTAAFEQFLASCPMREELRARLAQVSSDRPETVTAVSQQASDWLGELPMSPEAEREVLQAWRGQGEHRAYAVRSSATAEDAAQHSFAGQFESCLNVRGEAALLEAIRKCWLSVFSERVLAYHAKNGLSPEKTAMAVIVQEMVLAEHAGVLFTADPATGSAGRIVIESVPGTGERLVAGQVNPERIILNKRTLRILRRRAPEDNRTTREARSCSAHLPVGERAGWKPGATAPGFRTARRDAPIVEPPFEPRSSGHESAPFEIEGMHEPTPAGCDGSGVQRANPQSRFLAEPLVRRLGKLARKVECCFGRPQDIEWAGAGGRVFLLQARPITATRPARSWEDRQVWSNINAGEVAPDVMSPITWSLIQLLIAELARPLFRLLGADGDRAPGVGLIAGRIYFNANTGLAAVKPFAGLLWRIPNATNALGGAQIALYEDGTLDFCDEDLPDLGFRWPKYVLSWPRILYDLITHSPRRGDAWTVGLKAHWDALAKLELDGLSAVELAQAFDRLLRSGFKGWDLLYLIEQAAALPWFQWACHKWLDDPDLTLGYRLFTALGGVPETEAALALWRLALLAHADPATEALLLADEPWATVRTQLDRAEHGRQFLAAWQVFIAEHGHHRRGELELFNARWSERPDYILGLVRGYLRSIGQTNPLENQRRLAEEREQLTTQCRQRLRNPIKRWIFNRALRRAQKLAINREEWKNQCVRQMAFLCLILLRLGEQLKCEGLVAAADDVFFLEIPELAPVAARQAQCDVRAVIGQRRADYEKNLTLTPPPVVVGRFDPTKQTLPAADANATVLQGIPVFPGVVTGPARVILRTDDHERVLPGEILVAPFTDPAWTPYFLTAAGVVMDLGGILSHGSIVAREFGLPAVTNVGSATKSIRTGDQLQVDGGAGRVIILKQSERKS